MNITSILWIIFSILSIILSKRNKGNPQIYGAIHFIFLAIQFIFANYQKDLITRKDVENILDDYGRPYFADVNIVINELNDMVPNEM